MYPKRGRPIKKPSRGGGCLAVLLAVIVLVVFAVRDKDIPEGASTKPSKGRGVGNRSGAFVAAQGFVEDKLLSPGTADFGRQTHDGCVTDLGERGYAVKGWVDSQNVLGAKVRNYFYCVLQYESQSEKWLLQAIKLEDSRGRTTLME